MKQVSPEQRQKIKEELLKKTISVIDFSESRGIYYVKAMMLTGDVLIPELEVKSAQSGNKPLQSAYERLANEMAEHLIDIVLRGAEDDSSDTGTVGG